MESALRQNYQTSRLKQHYGVIEFHERERLIDPDWKEQPMRSWSEVYDELCCEVGRVYGLNDIREA